MKLPASRQTLIGVALIAVGLALLAVPSLYVHYSNQRASQSASALRESITAEWSEPSEEPAPDDSALLFIPKIDVWGVPIVEGTDDSALAMGVGRYPSSTFPGQSGNFALAGHRTANGEPFADIDELAAGDVVIVRTRKTTFRYRLLEDVVVKPDKTWVIGDVTSRLGISTDSAVISLVTCSPKWSTENRWVWWGVLIDDA